MAAMKKDEFDLLWQQKIIMDNAINSSGFQVFLTLQLKLCMSNIFVNHYIHVYNHLTKKHLYFKVFFPSFILTSGNIEI